MVLISTYWNVNSFEYQPVTQPTSVLISTYWNVNKKTASYEEKVKSVLISTYWNVNALNIPWAELNESRFNLNLLECKYFN